MAHYAIVIADPALAREKEFERNLAANIAAHGRDSAGLRAHVARIVGPAKPVGELHAALDAACPDGLPNCRNCGDPAHAEACAKAGHCPHCGTLHGIAPASVVAAHGYECVEVEAPAEGQVWDRASRGFVKA